MYVHAGAEGLLENSCCERGKLLTGKEVSVLIPDKVKGVCAHHHTRNAAE